MRPIEILIPILLLPYLLRPLLPAALRAAWISYLPAAALAAVFLHLIIEGYRWQMAPLYLLTIILLLLSARSGLQPAGVTSFPQALAALAGLVLLIAGALLPALLPVLRLPEPTGPYPIGTTSFVLTDRTRADIYAGTPDEPRRLIVQAWYPANPAPRAERALWMEDVQTAGPAMARWFKFPAFALGHLRLARTHAYKDAPLPAGSERFPVLLFSHGWSGFRFQNTFQMEELASHGYVIFGVQHTYGSVITVFPDGQVARLNGATLPSGLPDDEYIQAANRLADQWSTDLAFVLNTIEERNAADPDGRFTSRLDLERLGVMGHSMGGGASVQFCGTEPRCRAGLGMDAYLIPVAESVLEAGLGQPFLFLYSELWPKPTNMSFFERLLGHSPNAAAFSIQGTAHYDFTDLPLFSPVAAQLGLKGPLDGRRALRIINDYSLAFFDHTLKGAAAPARPEPEAAYPEVSPYK